MSILIFKHYFKRAFSYPVYLAIFLGVPLGVIALNGSIGGLDLLGSFNMGASVAGIMIVLSFQFFNTGMIFFFLFKDLKEDMRFRLGAAPCHVNRFVFSAIAANWFFSVVLGIVIILISSLIFNVHWGNPLIFGIVFLLTSLIGSLLAILLFIFVKKHSVAETIHLVFCFGIMILCNLMFNIRMEDGFLTTALHYSSPLMIGTRAVLYSGPVGDPLPYIGEGGMEQAIFYTVILAAITLVLAIIAGIAGRRRTF